jgi:hypothetical protein
MNNTHNYVSAAKDYKFMFLLKDFSHAILHITYLEQDFADWETST